MRLVGRPTSAPRAAGYAATLLLTVGTTSAMIATPTAHATTPTPRFASPVGTTGDSCDAGDPCNIEKAINDAPLGTDVTIEPGNYTTATKLQDPLGTLHIHGVVGAAAPVITSSQSTYAFYLVSASSLSHVTVVASAANTGVFDLGGPVDHVKSIDGTDFGSACAVYNATLSDSLCLSTGASGMAFDVFSSSAGPSSPTITLRGVTAVATGSDGVGIYNETGEFTTQTVAVTNSIVHGAGTDVHVVSSDATGDAIVTLSHSDSATSSIDAGPGAAAVNRDATDITAPATFRNPVANDYRVTAGSPTLDRGAKDPATDVDLSGQPRTLGPKPDMGGYELRQKPSAHALKLTKHTATSVHMTAKINSEGLPTTVTLIAVHNGKRIVSHAKAVGHTNLTKTVTLSLHGLKRHTTYKLHAVAANAAGRAATPTKTVS